MNERDRKWHELLTTHDKAMGEGLVHACTILAYSMVAIVWTEAREAGEGS
jgi:hypothetical protein